MKKSRPEDRTVSHYAKSVKVFDRALATQLLENDSDKIEGQRVLDKLGLPQWANVTLRLDDFFNSPEQIINGLKTLDSNQFHVSLSSKIPGREKIKKFPAAEKEIVEFINENVSPSERGDFTLILRETSENIYSGNVIVNDDGSVYLEAGKGRHLEFVNGQTTPTIFGIRNPFTKVTGIHDSPSGQNRIKDPDLDYLFLKTINLIPKDSLDQDHKPKPHPGYYEFVIAEDNINGGLRPVFTDYRVDSIYRIPFSQFTLKIDNK